MRAISLKYKIALLFFIAAMATGCRKYLDAKQNQKLEIPQTVQDLQSLLDDWFRMNQNYPESGEISADDYYLLYDDWSGYEDYIRRTYTWEKDYLFNPGSNNAWTVCYNNIYTANTALYYLDKIQRTNNDQAALNNVKGTALFQRAVTFAHVAWTWSLAYDNSTADSDLGIPLRLDPDFNTPSVRSSVRQTYDRVIMDLKEASQLLPGTPVHVIRPSKAASYGWLARVYLSMRNYDSALVYAGKCLEINNYLLDYNSLDETSSSPISSFNGEVIYHSMLNKPLFTAGVRIDSTLYNQYDDGDLRKTIFFRPNGAGAYRFKGSYDGTNNGGSWFNGIATDEMYLIKAECYARNGLKDEALETLNTLMAKRRRNDGSWIPFSAATSADALNIILLERRKELTERGLRWVDIKRLNKEGADIVIKRELDSQLYTLLPNDPKYALPIPEDVISITSMLQNPR